MYTIFRIELDGTKSVVTCVDDAMEIGPAIDADRDAIDYEASYQVAHEKGVAECTG